MSAPDVAGLPWPEGDPGALRGAARSVSALGSELESFSSSVAAFRSPAGWSGAAATAYSSAVTEQSQMLRSAGGALPEVSGALEDLATTVEEAQDRVRKLAVKVREAETAAAQAAAQAAAASAAASVALVAAQVPGAGAAATAAADVASRIATGAAANASGMQDHAASVRAMAIAEAEEECARVRRADARTATVVDGAQAPAGGASYGPTSPPSMRLGRYIAPLYAPIFVLDGDERTPPAPILHHTFTVTDDGELQIQYWRYHSTNDYPAPLGIADHPQDWERTSIQFDQSGRPAYVGYDAHDSPRTEHTRVLPWDDAERAGSRPYVYVMEGGHGGHPSPDDYGGPVPIADDVPDGRGDVWAPDADHVVDGRGDPVFYDGYTPGPIAPPARQLELQDLGDDLAEDGPARPDTGIDDAIGDATGEALTGLGHGIEWGGERLGDVRDAGDAVLDEADEKIDDLGDAADDVLDEVGL